MLTDYRKTVTASACTLPGLYMHGRLLRLLFQTAGKFLWESRKKRGKWVNHFK